MDFRNAYAQGFARVAACTVPVALADPARNAERVIGHGARVPRRRASRSPSSPSCRCRGYAIDDLLLQDVLLDAVDDAVVTIAEATAKPAPRRRRRRPAATRQPALQLRGRHPPRRGPRRRAEVATCPTTASSTRSATSRSGDDHRGEFIVRPHWPGADVDGEIPFGPDLIFDPRGPARPRRARRDLRGHVGARAAEPRGRARRGDRPAQPLRLPDHRRARRGPPPARPLGERALHRRLPLRRRERG